jgi:hypothetical protein
MSNLLFPILRIHLSDAGFALLAFRVIGVGMLELGNQGLIVVLP